MHLPAVYIVPHPPELFSVFRDEERAQESRQTAVAYQQVVDEVFSQSPNTLVFLQNLGGIYPDGLTFFVPEDGIYQLSYEGMGTDKEGFDISCDHVLAQQIQKSLHDYERKSYVIKDPALPHSVSLFLDQYHEKLPAVEKILVLGVSLEGSERQYEYGSLIARALKADQETSAVIGIGQLSHCLDKDSEAGYIPDARYYDRDIRSHLEKADWDKLMAVDPFFVEEVGENLYKVLCCSLGILESKIHKTAWNTMSYESPHGIGYLVGRLSAN